MNEPVLYVLIGVGIGLQLLNTKLLVQTLSVLSEFMKALADATQASKEKR